MRRAIDALQAQGKFERCIALVAGSASAPGLQWIGPYAGMTMAEYFRDKGQHALIVIDDLSKHVATHREIALLTRQSPGREASPGDAFYIHARRSRARPADLLTRGARIREVLRQSQHMPFRLTDEVALMLAEQAGLLDPLPLAEVARFRAALPGALDRDGADVVSNLADRGELDEEARAKLMVALTNLAASFSDGKRKTTESTADPASP